MVKDRPSNSGDGSAQPTPFHDELFRAPDRGGERSSTTATVDTPAVTTDAAPRTTDASTRPAGDAPTPAPRGEWTLAINLAANGTFDENIGASQGWKRLQDMAAETKGSPVNLIVQVAEPAPRGSRGHRDEPGQGATIKRYMISNGEIRELATNPSRGIAGDVEDLLRAANQYAPANHVGLVQQSHGGGTDGVEGTAGNATLPQFAAAIRNGLQGSGHDKLDLVDFNACSMASASVLQEMAPVANNMVASAEMEFSAGAGSFDGQNMQAAIRGLIARPQSTGADFAANMIRLADAGVNDGMNDKTGRMESGTPTLAHFDLTHLGEFNQSLGALGDALAAQTGTPGNLAAINRAIETSPIMPRNSSHMAGHPLEQRDLTSFANNLLGEINDGKFADPEGHVRKALQDLLAAQGKVEPEHHARNENGYEAMGGLNAFLPDLEIRDPAKSAGNDDPMPNLLYQTQRDNDYATIEHRTAVEGNIARELATMGTMSGGTHAAELQQLQSDFAAVKAAQNETEFRAALNALDDKARAMSQSGFGAFMNAQAHRRTRDHMFTAEQLNVPGWQRFMETLRVSEEH